MKKLWGIVLSVALLFGCAGVPEVMETKSESLVSVDYILTDEEGRTTRITNEFEEDVPMVRHYNWDPDSKLWMRLLWIDERHQCIGIIWELNYPDDHTQFASVIWVDWNYFTVDRFLGPDWTDGYEHIVMQYAGRAEDMRRIRDEQLEE